jgi:predicted AlkP superfamily pyrophosphatase or phosphodiesterase
MPWFVHHQASLYWLAVAAGLAAENSRSYDSERWRTKEPCFILTAAILLLAGVYISIFPFLPGLQSNQGTYWWSIVSLLPIAGLALRRSSNLAPGNAARKQPASFAYSTGLLVALVVSAIYTVSVRLQVYKESHSLGAHAQDVELALWSLVCHTMLAVAVLSVLNLIYLMAARTSKPSRARRWMIGTCILAALWLVLRRFLDNSMSFDGPSASGYALALSLALTILGFWTALPILERLNVDGANSSPAAAAATWTVMAILAVLALMSRSLIGGEDWNGFVGGTWALSVWIAMSLCVYRLLPARSNYSGAVILSTLLASAIAYKSLQATEIFWGKPLGSTDDEISLKFEEYADRDSSFLLAHHVLGNNRNEVCGDMCRILRQYTNVRDTHISQGVKLVDHLSAAPGERPNIFMFVIDSMRPDYLGAYNQSIDYTPNLDALARDSIVFHKTYTQYAGTSISEPAIWAGAQLLHTHFPQPFDEVNSLRTLAKTDSYQLVVSHDTVLQQLLTPNDNLTRLDIGKLWNSFEACSTVAQLESVLDAKPDKVTPVLFYAQPMNVHQFARNDVPSPTSQHWPERPRLNTRITYEVHWVDSCLGQFFSYLKQRGMYDNSIIIVTSDHGDATGEFGRRSHSISIWPEVMHVPLIIHLPPALRQQVVYDDKRLAALTDITPTLFYLLGHKPIRHNALYGRPLFAASQEELDSYPQRDLFLASDLHAVYGILTADGRYLYTTYDSPARSYLFDLSSDPNAQHDILTPAQKQRYDEEIIEHLQAVGDYYGYKPGVGSLLASAGH